MTCATAALIGFQGYWIYQARLTAQQRFDQNIHEALQNVVNKLQQAEVIWLVTQQQQNTLPDTMLAAVEKTEPLPKEMPQQRLPNRRTLKPLPQSIQTKQVARQDSSFSEWLAKNDYLKETARKIQFKTSVADSVEQAWENYPVIVQFQWYESYSENGSPQLSLHADTLVTDSRPVESYPRSRKKLAEVATTPVVTYTPEQEAERQWALMLRKQKAIEQWLDDAMREQSRQMGLPPDAFVSPFEEEQPTYATRKEAAIAKKTSAKQPLAAEKQEQLSKVQEQSQMVKNVFHQLVAIERPIEQRIDGRTLDSLLKVEIQNQQIAIPFQYGVHGVQSDKIFFASYQPKQINIPDGSYTATLFPNDLHAKGDYLYVYFPDKQQFINSSTFRILLASVVLCVAIMGLFYVSVNTIVKQKKLSEVKNDFINNMTHEFKTPIATISLACEMLQDSDIQTHPQQLNRYLRVIQDENQRLGSQVEKVLQAAVLEKVRLKFTTINIHDILDNVLQNIGVQIEKRNGHLQLQLDADHSFIEGDELHITNVLYNLLDNANKYSPEAPQITISTQNVANGIQISIADCGIGMSKEAIGKIFDKFFRVSTGNIHNVKGFGLGLSYVKTIAEAHHGGIQVKSQPGVGSTFELFLPLHQVLHSSQ